ncbi:MAG: hypothetical protein LUH46_11690 [Alistipes sp.]|nr:hypothetical protein [Alistipes sp.]
MNSRFLLTVILVGLSSCASIPRATVDMSMMLGQQIDALELGHIATINAYYKEKEQAAILFLDKVWYHRYLNDLFAGAETTEFWNEVLVEELPQRIESLKSLTELIQSDYMEKRTSLLIPLEKGKNELLEIVREHYAVAREMNELITENVSSAHNVEEKYKRLFSKFTDSDKIEQQMNRYLLQADSILNAAQTTLEKVDNKLK